jgi:hypothetical protein
MSVFFTHVPDRAQRQFYRITFKAGGVFWGQGMKYLIRLPLRRRDPAPTHGLTGKFEHSSLLYQLRGK